MSILFKKLNGLKARSGEDDGINLIDSDQPENVYTLKKLMFSPRGGMVIFLILVGAGLVSFTAMSWVKAYLDDRMDTVIVVRDEQPENLSGAAATDSADPTGSGLAPPGRDVPGAPVMIPDASVVKEIPKLEVPDFFVHTSWDKSMKIPAKPVVPGNDPLPKKAAGLKADQFFNLNKTPSIYSTDGWVEARRQKNTGFTHLSPTGIRTQYSSNTAGPGMVSPLTQVKTGESSPEPAALDTPDPVKIEKRKQAFRQAALRKARKKRSAQVASVARLGLDFKQALDRGNTGLATDVLARIGRLKGKNSPYYLKLSAFKHIRDAQYPEARQVLEQVLLQAPLDLDAGLNMAVVQMRLGETSQARRRLEHLKSVYPGDTRVDDLLGMF